MENVSVCVCMGVVGVLGGGWEERSNSLTQISSVFPSSRGVKVYLVSQGRLTFSYEVRMHERERKGGGGDRERERERSRACTYSHVRCANIVYIDHANWTGNTPQIQVLMPRWRGYSAREINKVWLALAKLIFVYNSAVGH